MVNLEPVDNDKIVALAEECIGTPFKHQGRIVGVGMDCAGVLVHILKSELLPCVDELGYPRVPYRGLIRKILDSQPALTRIEKKELRRGDVLLMRLRREPQHVAIFTGKTIIHSYSTIGSVVEHEITDEWRIRIVQTYRIFRPVNVR